MPYILASSRTKLDQEINKLIGKMDEFDRDPLIKLSAGDLNYILTRLAIGFSRIKGSNYQSFNDVLGAFEGAKLEFYRRLVADYEDTKIKYNGDVY